VLLIFSLFGLVRAHVLWPLSVALPDHAFSQDREDWEWLLGVGLGLLFAVLSHYWLERRFYQSRFSVGRNGLA